MDCKHSVVRLVALLAGIAHGVAHAADPLGFYIGGGAGVSQVRGNLDFGGSLMRPISFEHNTTGWKVLAGIRPLSAIGAEAEYIDFGSVNDTTNIAATTSLGGVNETATTHPRAAAIFGVAYLPIPLPYLDVFAKAGVAELKSSVHANATVSCPLGIECLVINVLPYANRGTSTRPAYGAGMQVKFAGFAARVEYERISASSEYPDLLSFGLAWRF